MNSKNRYNVQLISDGQKWPYVGRAYPTKDGGFNIYLDDDVILSGGQKLHVRPARAKAEAAAEPAPAAATANE